MPSGTDTGDVNLGGVERSTLEIMIAQMENRIRSGISDLVMPTVQKVNVQSDELASIRSHVKDHTYQIFEVMEVVNKVTENKAIVNTMRDELTKMDSKVHVQLTKQHEENKKISLELEKVQKNLEQKESAIQHLQRSIERASLELNRAQDQIEQQGPEFIDKRIDENRRHAHKLIYELEAKIVGLQIDHATLSDQLWGEETGLAKVTGEVAKTNHLVEIIRSSVSELQAAAVSPADLVKVQDTVAAWLRKAEADMSGLRNKVGTVVDETREHLRTGLETVAQQTAHFVGEVRRAYEEEIKASEILRRDVEGFVGDTREQLATLHDRVSSVTTRIEELVNDNLELIQRNDLARKRDRAATDLETKGVHKRLTHMSDSLDKILKGIEHLYSVTGLVLEVSDMQCSLQAQDFLDRDSVQLLGLQEKQLAGDDTMKSDTMTSTMKSTGGMHASPGRKKVGKQVISVEKRCLSCSGQAPTILSAFKMACLQYTPSPVSHGGKEFTRHELLKNLEQVVKKATSKYRNNNQEDIRTNLPLPEPPPMDSNVPAPRGLAPAATAKLGMGLASPGRKSLATAGALPNLPHLAS